MTNPFIFGSVVTGDDFAGREEETKSLEEEIHSGQDVILTSPRRYGKTSLIINTLNTIKQDYIYLDCSIFTSQQHLASVFLSELLSKYPKKRIMEIIASFLKTLKLTFTLEPLKITLEQKPAEKDLKEILELPEKLEKKIVVVFDEFQDFSALAPNILAMLRSVIQFHKKTVYIFAGSKKHMMQNIFHTQDSPFFNFGTQMTLGPIKGEEFISFAERKFKETGVAIDKKTLMHVLDYTNCQPYYTQVFLHFLWNISKEERGDLFSKTLLKIVSNYAPQYSLIFSSLANHQKATLYALAKDSEKIFSKGTIERYNLISSQHVQKSLLLLQNKDIVEKNSHYYVADIFFKQWIVRQFE